MKGLLKEMHKSFLNKDGNGYSARKLSAFIIMLCISVAHFSWLRNSFLNNDYSLLSEVLIIDFGFVSVALGLTTYEQVAKWKNPKKDE